MPFVAKWCIYYNRAYTSQNIKRNVAILVWDRWQDMKLRYFKISIAVISVKICGDCFIYFYDNIFIPKDVNTRQGSASSFPSGIY